MKKSIDAKGLACPQPVIMSRKMMAAGNLDEIEVMVDNDAARENVVRFLKFTGSAEPRVASAGSVHTITAMVSPTMIAKAGRRGDCPCVRGGASDGRAAQYRGKTLFFSADQVGRGDETLGKLLVRGLLYTVSELQRPPKTLVFMNSGVRLAAEREETIELLKTIQAKGRGDPRLRDVPRLLPPQGEAGGGARLQPLRDHREVPRVRRRGHGGLNPEGRYACAARGSS